MRFFVSGGTGFLGTPLVEALARRGSVVVATRSARSSGPVTFVSWNDEAWRRHLSEADVVVNLAGENIAGGRWTERRKASLRSSRIDTTRRLVETMRSSGRRDQTLVNASAVGYYGVRGDEPLPETAAPGDDYLGRLCVDWEAEALRAEEFARVVRLRFGVVLAQDGGMIGRLLLPFRLGVGGPLGDGRQWLSWVEREDAIGAAVWAIESEFSGALNVVAPGAVTNAEFTAELARQLRRPAFLRVPATAIGLIFGEMGKSLLLGGQRAVPEALREGGFSFAFPNLPAALARILPR